MVTSEELTVDLKSGVKDAWTCTGDEGALIVHRGDRYVAVKFDTFTEMINWLKRQAAQDFLSITEPFDRDPA